MIDNMLNHFRNMALIDGALNALLIYVFGLEIKNSDKNDYH